LRGGDTTSEEESNEKKNEDAKKIKSWADLTEEDFLEAVRNSFHHKFLRGAYPDANLEILSEVLTRYADGKPATVAVFNPFKNDADLYHYEKDKDDLTKLHEDTTENKEQLKFFKSLAKITFAKENIEETEEWLRNKVIPPGEVLIEDKKRNLSIDTSKCAEQLEKLFNFFTKVTKKSEDEKKVETLYLYHEDTGIWQADGEQVINRIMESQFRPIISTRVVNEVIDHVKRKNYADLDKITVKSTLVNFKNGVLDLDTLQLLPHSPKYFFFNYIDLNWNPRPKVPEKIIRFLATLAAPNDDNFVSLLETPAYSILRGYPIKRAIAIVGETNTGKSTFLLLLQKFIGDKFVSHLSMQQMADAAHGQPFALTSIKGKLLNLSDELPPKYVQDVSIFKQLTGSSIIEGEHKFGGREAFMNQAKLIFSANQMPRPSEDSDAFHSRWQFIELAGDIIEKIKKIDPNARKKAQEEVVEELREEFEDFLPILVLIAKKKLLPQKDFSAVRTIEENTEMYQKYSHTSEIFLQTMVQEDANAEISKEQLFQAYQNWCQDNGYLVDSQKLFFSSLKSMFPNSQERFFTENTIRKRHIIGIKLKTKGTNAADDGDNKKEEKKFKVDLEQYFDIKLENGESDATAQDAQHAQDFTYLIKIFKEVLKIYKEVKEKLVQPDQPVQTSNTILDTSPEPQPTPEPSPQPPPAPQAREPDSPSLNAQAQAAGSIAQPATPVLDLQNSQQVPSPSPAGSVHNATQKEQTTMLMVDKPMQQQEAPETTQEQEKPLTREETLQRVYFAIKLSEKYNEPFWSDIELGEPNKKLYPALQGLNTYLIQEALKTLQWQGYIVEAKPGYWHATKDLHLLDILAYDNPDMPVYCPNCMKPVTRLYWYDAEWLCVDCLNARQHQNDDLYS